MNKFGLRLLRYLLLFGTEFILSVILAFIFIESIGKGNDEVPDYALWSWTVFIIILNILWALIATKGKKAIQIICGIVSGCIIPVLSQLTQDFQVVTAIMVLSVVVFWELMNKLKVVSFENSVLSSLSNKQKKVIWNVIDKIILSILIIYFVFLITLNFIDKKGIFLILTWFISLLYGIGGYWFFNKDEKKFYAIPILAGIIFGASIETWHYSVFLLRDRFDVLYLPILNGAFFGFLVICLIKEKDQGAITKTIKGVFIRSFIILIVTGFLSYTPPTFNIYRRVLSVLNYGNVDLQANLKIYDDHLKYVEAANRNDCDMAIKYSKEEMQDGFTWLFYVPDDTASLDRMRMLDNILNSDSLIQYSTTELIFKSLLDSVQLNKIRLPLDDISAAYKCRKKSLP